MMKKRFMAFLVAGTVITGACGTYAAYVDTVKVNNKISTGIVDVNLDEFQREANGKLVAYENDKVVLPGDKVSKVPRITNQGEPCYIRAELTFDGEPELLTTLSDKNISGISEDWVKIGDYYYYTKVLGKKEQVDIFDTFLIPASWTESYSDKNINLVVRTEAIQSANFTPDFSAMSPWGNQTIELAVKEQNGDIEETQKNVKLSVEFNGKAHKLIAAPSDFFSNFPVAMPGDTFTDSVNLSNTTDKEAELFFCALSNDKDPKQIDLLKNMGLEISYGGNVLYDGTLQAEDLSKEYISLGKYKPGDTGKLDFKITVPKKLNNAYALRNADVQWVFTVREEEPKAAPQDESTSSTDYGAPAEHGISTASPAKTGDEAPILAFVCIGSAALFAIAIVLIRKRGD